MDVNNTADEELMFEQAAALSNQQSQETEKRIADVQSLTSEQKNDRILDLEDEKAQLEHECEKLEAANARLGSERFKWSLGCIAGLIALSGALYALIHDGNQKQAYQEQIQALENDLRSAVLSDEAHSKLVRAVFAREVIAAAEQKTEATPSEVVDFAIAYIKEQKSQGNLAVEDFQVRVIGQDLKTLATVAEKTKTNTENFLKAVAVYALNKPDEYAQSTTPVVQSRARVDNLLIHAGQKER